MAIRSLSVPSGDGQCCALQGMRIATPSARNDRGSGDMVLLFFSGGHWGTARGPFPTFFHTNNRPSDDGRIPLTIPRTWDILSIESGATGRRFPQSCYKEEVTAGLRDGRLLLFINDLDDQRDQRDDEHTECEKLGPCNQTDHPLFFRIGGKEDYPRKRGNRLPLLVAPVIE